MADVVTYTTNYLFSLPPFDYQRWQDLVNNNMRTIDALLAKYVSVLNVKGVWANSTVYVAEDVTVDPIEGQLYRSTTNHVSAASPTTFAEYRAANPGVWVSATLGVRARGVWVAGEDYALGDFVVSDNIFAICTTAHTAGTVFLSDSIYWSYLIDLRSVTEFKAIDDYTTAHTLVLTDANKLLRLTGTTARTFTVPLNSVVAFPIRTQLMVTQAGTGVLTLAGSGGVTLDSEFGRYTLNAQHSVATLLKVGTDEWLLTGSLRP